MFSNCFFHWHKPPKRLLLQGYVNDQQAELNFNFLKSTKMEPLEVLVVLEVSKYSFHVLWPLTAIFQPFIREQLFTFSFLDFSQTVIYLILSDRLLWHRHLNGQPLQLRALYLDMVCTKPCLLSALHRRVCPFSVPSGNTCRRFPHYNKSWQTETGRFWNSFSVPYENNCTLWRFQCRVWKRTDSSLRCSSLHHRQTRQGICCNMKVASLSVFE